MEQVSSIIQTKTTPKYKGIVCLKRAITIRATHIEHALLDLGASTNLLPYSVYQQLGLGMLKPTNVILKLADRSTRVPRGMVEVVLIQVDEFYFPTYFIMLDTQPVTNSNTQIPVILGWPFLAISNAFI